MYSSGSDHILCLSLCDVRSHWWLITRSTKGCKISMTLKIVLFYHSFLYLLAGIKPWKENFLTTRIYLVSKGHGSAVIKIISYIPGYTNDNQVGLFWRSGSHVYWGIIYIITLKFTPLIIQFYEFWQMHIVV